MSAEIARVLVFMSLVVACTAPPPEPGSLPSSEPPSTRVMTFAVEPDAPPPPARPAPVVPREPEHERAFLLASSSSASVFAVSDHHRVWLADADDQLHEIPRAETQAWIAAIDVDADGKLWVLEGGGRLSVTAGPAWAPSESDIVPVAHASTLSVTPERITVVGALAEPPAWADYDRAVQLEAQLGYLPDAERVVARRVRGQTWQLSPTPYDGNMFDDVTVTADGELQLFDGDERDCGGGGQHRWSSRGGRRWTELDWPLDVTHDRHAGVDGWSYAVTTWPEDADVSQFVAVDRAGEVEGLFPVEDRYAHGHGHGRTLVLTEGGLWSVTANAATRIGPPAPEQLALQVQASTVDARGRLLLLAGDDMHIGGGEGWTRASLSRSPR